MFRTRMIWYHWNLEVDKQAGDDALSRVPHSGVREANPQSRFVTAYLFPSAPSAHTHSRWKTANIIGAHHDEQRAAPDRDREPGGCYCECEGTADVRGVLESQKRRT